MHSLSLVQYGTASIVWNQFQYGVLDNAWTFKYIVYGRTEDTLGIHSILEGLKLDSMHDACMAQSGSERQPRAISE